MARQSGLRSRRSDGVFALRKACMLALMRSTSAGIFNLFAASPPPPQPLPPALPPLPAPCPAAQYQFSTAWIAPVAASIATRFGMPAASAQVVGVSLVATYTPQLAPLVGTCQPCSPGCAVCATPATCAVCAPGFALTTLSALADGLLGTPPPTPPPPPATVVSALAAAAAASSAAAGNVTLCLPQAVGYGLEGVLGAAACALLPASAASLFPACAAAPVPPLLSGARVIGNASNSSNASAAPPSAIVAALSGPPVSTNSWLAVAQTVASAATPLARVAAAAVAAGSTLTATSIKLMDPRLLSGAAEPAKLLAQAAALAAPALDALGVPPAAAAAVNASAAALARQSVQLYVSCNAAPLPHATAAASAATPTPLLRSTFWTLLPAEVQAANVTYAVRLPLGVWPAGGNASAVLCLLYQWNVVNLAPRAVGAASVFRANFSAAAPVQTFAFAPIDGHPVSGAGNATAVVASWTLACPGCALNTTAADFTPEVVARLLSNAVATRVAGTNMTSSATTRTWSWSLASLLSPRNATVTPSFPPPPPPAITAQAGRPNNIGWSQLLSTLFGRMIPPPPPQPPPAPPPPLWPPPVSPPPLPPPPLPPSPSPLPPPLLLQPPPPVVGTPALPPPSMSPSPAAAPPQSYGINSVAAASPPPPPAADPPLSPPPLPPPPVLPPAGPLPPEAQQQPGTQAAEQPSAPALASAPASMTAPTANVSDRGRRTALIVVCAIFGIAVCAVGSYLLMRRCCCGGADDSSSSPRLPISARGRAPPGGGPTRTWQMPHVVAQLSPRRREALTNVVTTAGGAGAPPAAATQGRSRKNMMATEV